MDLLGIDDEDRRQGRHRIDSSSCYVYIIKADMRKSKDPKRREVKRPDLFLFPSILSYSSKCDHSPLLAS